MSAAAALVRATRLAGADRRRLWLSLLLGVLAAGAAIGLLVTSGYLISAAALGPPILTLTVAIVSVRTFAVLRATSRYAERLSSHDVALRVLADTRRRLYDRLVPLVPGGLLRLRGGDLLSRAIADVDSLQHLYVRALGPPVVAAIVCALAVVVAWIMLPAAGVVLALVLGGAAIALPLASAAAGRRAGRRQAPARAALTAEVLEAIQLAPELVAYGLEDDRIERVRATDRRLTRTSRSDAAIGATGTGVVTALAGVAAALVLAVSIPAVVSGALDGVLLAALALLALAAVDTLAPLPVAAQHLSATATAMERLEEITERPPPVADPAHPVPVGPRPALALEGARLRYAPDGPWVLDGVDLRLAPGRRVAVVGQSGAGKSTIANALVRFRDLDGGRYLIDGVDARRHAQADIRRVVRLCEQDALLFATGIRENVRIGDPTADDARVARALERAGLGDWLAGLPEGLDTPVGEAGTQVSGGQRSRIALARALVSRAPVLILDEPTAHLDAASTRAFVDDLVAGGAGESVLLITHSPIGLEAFDEVVLLEDGRVAARGRHEELLADGRYRALLGLDPPA